MSSLTVNSTTIANTTQEQVYLKERLGSYELVFNFSLQGNSNPNKLLWGTIYSARIYVKPEKGKQRRTHDLGGVNLEKPVTIEAKKEYISEHFSFYLPLSDQQLFNLEKIRDGGDLEFEIAILGQGGDGKYDNPVHDRWRIRMSQSDWLGKLNQVGYVDTLLLEIPVDMRDADGNTHSVSQQFREAQADFANGKYRSCVNVCREVIQDFGHDRFGKKNWYDAVLKVLGRSPRDGDGKNRQDMVKQEREQALWASLRHYTHQSHHTTREGGEKEYSRSEAYMVLTLTAAFICSQANQ